MTLDRDDSEERIARLDKLMREARPKPAAEAENPAPVDEKRSPKAAQAKAAGPPDGAERRRSKRR
jgi:hypothetical protein